MTDNHDSYAYVSPGDCSMIDERNLLQRDINRKLEVIFQCLWYGNMDMMEHYFSKNTTLYVNNTQFNGLVKVVEWFTKLHPQLIKIKRDYTSNKIILISNDYVYHVRDISKDEIQVLAMTISLDMSLVTTE